MAEWDIVSNTPDPWAVVSHEAHEPTSKDYDPTPKGGVPEGFHEIRTNGAPYIVHDQTVADAIRALSDLPGVGMAERFGQGATRLAGKAASGIAGLFGGPDTVQHVQNAVNEATELPPSNDPFVTASNAAGNVASQIAAPVDRAIGNIPAGPRTLIEATEEATPDVLPLVGGLGTSLAGRMTNGTKMARTGAEVREAAGYTGLKTKADLTSPGNQAITDMLISKDAGIIPGQRPSVASLQNAIKVGPARVYRATEEALPPRLVQDPQLQEALGNLPQQVSQLPRSPDVEALQETMLAQPEFTRDELFANIREARERAKVHWKSDDPDKAALGDAYHSLANAYEDFTERQPGVDLPAWKAARVQMAKNYQAQAALRGPQGGEHFNPLAYARIMEKDPHLLTGNAAIVGHVANTLPSALPPGTMPGLSEAAGQTAGIIPVAGPLLKAKLEQLRLRGNPELAANADTNPALSYFRSQGRLPEGWNRAPVEPQIAGLLPSPDMVNAGGGATTANTLRDLGLTPDVQAAGASHPAAARLAALREQLASAPERSAEPVDFQGPQKWGDFSLTPQQPVAPALQMPSIPFEDVLEQGGTERPPVGAPKTGYRPPSKSPKQAQVRTPPGAPEIVEGPLPGASPAQMAFRNKLAADRLRKVAGDLRVEGPGGAEGNPTSRALEALKRRERGYAAGGEVVDFAKRGLGALRERIAEAFHNPYTADTDKLRRDISKYWTTAVPAETALAPPPMLAAPNEPSLEDITRELHELLTPGASEQFADGGEVEVHPKQSLSDALARLAAVPSAGADPAAQEAYLERARTQVGDPMASLMRARAIINAQAPQQSVTPASAATPSPSPPSSVRQLADAARALNPYSAPEGAEDRARIAINLASLAYGLDAQGQPALGGRAWTSGQGGTPTGILDAITATPHNLIQLASMVDKYLPGKSNPQFWASADPAWSSQAADRLSRLRQQLQKSAGVAPAKSFEDTALDAVTDPALLVPLGAAKVAGEGTTLRRALNWGAGGGEDPAKPAQGYAKGGSVKATGRVRPIQDFPRDSRGLYIQPGTLTPEVTVQIEHNRARATKKAYYSDEHCGDQKSFDPAGKYNCGACNQAAGDHCLLVEDDLLPKLKNGRFPPLVIDRTKGSCGPYEIVDPNDPELRANRLPASLAGYGVRKGGGPEEVFGCDQCWKASKTKWPALLGRTAWCGEWGTTVQPKACCVVNGAPTTKRG